MTRADKTGLERICFILSFGTAEDTKAAAKALKEWREWRVVDLTISDEVDGDLNAVYIVRDFQVVGEVTEDKVAGELDGVLRLLPGLTPNRVRYAVSEDGRWGGYREI